MARGIGKLPASYQRLKPGLHSDGNCLYLQITIGPRNNRRLSWIFRYTRAGCRPRDMGLGGAGYISLAEARERARFYRQLVKQGIDPIAHRDAEIARNIAADAAVMSFDEACAAYIRQHGAEWTNPRHASEWPRTLTRYAAPIVGKMDVRDITTAHLMKILDPIWTTKTQTAQRLRGRIEAVLGWATVSGHREGPNPAQWKNHLDALLASPSKVQPVKPMPSLSYEAMPAFMVALRERQGTAALALEFCALTGVRSHDVRFAKRADVDVDKRIWTIPKFSKSGRPHVVPLADASLAVIEKAHRIATDIGGAVGHSAFLFPSDLTGQPLAATAMWHVLERMRLQDQATVHGFRSAFRTFLQERTNFPREVCEACLGHRTGNSSELAYARGDQVRKRAAIMQAWADFLAKPVQPGKVVPLSRQQSAVPA